MPNVNIPETENIKLEWTHQEQRRRQHLKKNDGHGCTGEDNKRAGGVDGDGLTKPGRYEKIMN